MKLSIIVPAKNEAKRIIPTVQDIFSELSKNFKPEEFEILVVINNSSDSTSNLVSGLTRQYNMQNVSVIDIGTSGGKGGAVLFGIKIAKGEVIGYVDADGSSPATEIIKLYNELQNSAELDVAISSRYVKGSRIIGKQPIYRYLLSRMFNISARVIFGLPFADTQCGMKLFRADAVKSISDYVVVQGWTFDVSILVALKLLGYTTKEFAGDWYVREGSNLKVTDTALKVFHEFSVIAASNDIMSTKLKSGSLRAKMG